MVAQADLTFALDKGGETALALENSTFDPTVDGIVAYVAFGVGAQNTAIGETMLDAPVHFLEGGESPIEEYARWIAIFAIPAEGSIRLASVVGFEEDVLSGLDKHLNEYYEAAE